MRRIREILRLRFEKHASVRTIAASCRVSKTTVGEILARAEAAGIGWPLGEDLDEEALVARLYPESATPMRQRPIPDWTSIDRELRRKGVTLQTLWSGVDPFSSTPWLLLHPPPGRRREPSLRRLLRVLREKCSGFG